MLAAGGGNNTVWIRVRVRAAGYGLEHLGFRSLTLSECEIVGLVHVPVDGGFTGEEPYFSVCRPGDGEALPAVPGYSLPVRDQSVKWELEREKRAFTRPRGRRGGGVPGSWAEAFRLKYS